MMMRNAFAILAVSLATALGISDQAQASVLAYWEFNDRTVGETSWNGQRLLDSSGNARDAFFSQWSTFEAGSPDYGNTPALRFKEDADQVAFRDEYAGWRDENGDSTGEPAAGTDINFDEPDSFTIEAVIRTAQFEGTAPVVSKDNPAGNGEWWWLVRDGVLHAFIEDESGLQSKAIGSVNVADDAWHHIAFVRDTGSDLLKIFVDYQLDVEVADVSVGTSANNEDIRIGRTNNGSYDFIGDIDFVRISDTSLVPGEFIQPGVQTSLPGDANNDGMVNDADAATLAANWQTLNGATWAMGDFNDDGVVDDIDATILAVNWQASSTASVPEPGVMALMAVALGIGLSLGWRVRACTQRDSY